MKQFRMLTTALAILTLSSCNKLIDHIKNHLDNDDKTYRIETWTRFDPETGYPYHGKFTYNANNDPVTFTGGGSFNWIFKYDKHKRLSETYMYERDPYFEKEYREYRKYKYNNKGQIVSDTTYEFGFWDSIPTPQNTYYRQTFYTYDEKGRMIKSVIQFQDSTDLPIIAEYSYDEDGNLVIPGFVYDKKMSFLRTNKVWMFLSRDYSVNNPFPA